MSTTAPVPSSIPPNPVPDVASTSSQNQPQNQAATSPQAIADDSSSSQVVVPAAEQQANYRLVIEEDKAAGSYVYMTIDPRTGKVISQIPREQLLRMREADDYQPGSVIDTRG